MATSQDKTSDDLDLESAESIEVSHGIPPEQDCVSPKDFTLLSGLSLSTVRRYLKDGRLPKIQLGGVGCRVLIPRDAVEQYLRSAANSDECVGPSPADACDDSKPTDCNQHRQHGPTPRWMERR